MKLVNEVLVSVMAVILIAGSWLIGNAAFGVLGAIRDFIERGVYTIVCTSETVDSMTTVSCYLAR